MSENSVLLLWIILLPVCFALLTLVVPAKQKRTQEALFSLGFLGNLVLNVLLIFQKELSFHSAWAGWEMDFALKQTALNGTVIFCAAIVSMLVAVFTIDNAKHKPYARPMFVCMLLTIAMANGAMLADNLVVMLFFWQGILATMFVMIQLGGKDAYKTSLKAVIINGVGDLCIMFGTGLVVMLAHTIEIERIQIPTSGVGALAFLFLVVGALPKLGIMPFHSWQPDAADEAPMPYVVFMTGLVEKLLGIYLLALLCNMFDLSSNAFIRVLLTVLGAISLIGGALMALVQRDLKRTLVYVGIASMGLVLMGAVWAVRLNSAGGVLGASLIVVLLSISFLYAGVLIKRNGTTELRKRSKKDNNHTMISDRVRSAPVLRAVFDLAEQKRLDPYEWGRLAITGYATASLKVNDAISWFYDVAVVRAIGGLSALVKWAHNGNQARYVVWVLGGVCITVAIYLLSN